MAKMYESVNEAKELLRQPTSSHAELQPAPPLGVAKTAQNCQKYLKTTDPSPRLLPEHAEDDVENHAASRLPKL